MNDAEIQALAGELIDAVVLGFTDDDETAKDQAVQAVFPRLMSLEQYDLVRVTGAVLATAAVWQAGTYELQRRIERLLG